MVVEPVLRCHQIVDCCLAVADAAEQAEVVETLDPWREGDEHSCAHTGRGSEGMDRVFRHDDEPTRSDRVDLIAGVDLDLAVDDVVAQWQRERPDLRTDAMALFGRLGRLAMLAEESINSTFTRNGLQRGEFDVLAALRRSGAPYELNPSVLAETLMLSRAGMTGRLDRLESATLVRRIANPDDRRSIRVALTEAGKDLVDRVVGEHVDNEERLIADLPKRDRAQLDRIVRTLLSSLET